MRIYLELGTSADKDEIIKTISKFRDVSKVYDAGGNIVVRLCTPISGNQKQKIKNLEKKYKLKGIKTVVVDTMSDEPETNMNDKSLHCFFDIDGTLTRGNGTINRKIRTIFDKMKKVHNIRIYLASGRSMPHLYGDMKEFQTEQYAIAENGGIILGLGDKETFGDRTQPDILHAHLLTHHRGICEDIDQGFRKTERIYLQSSISKRQINLYIKKSKAKVDIHPSKNSYHVSARGINKGTAIEAFATEMRFGPNDFVVAVGDADMDVPMLETSDLGFAVGNASSAAIRAASIPLEGEHEKGIAEMYEKLRKLTGLVT